MTTFLKTSVSLRFYGVFFSLDILTKKIKNKNKSKKTNKKPREEEEEKKATKNNNNNRKNNKEKKRKGKEGTR